MKPGCNFELELTLHAARRRQISSQAPEYVGGTLQYEEKFNPGPAVQLLQG